jgi:hypothetical protein
MDLERSTWPVRCKAAAPAIATAIASSHMRMRPQLPMFTMSETAPMVQKLVRCATAPTTKAIPKPDQVTMEERLEAAALMGVSRFNRTLLARPPRRPIPLLGRMPIPGWGGGHGPAAGR